MRITTKRVVNVIKTGLGYTITRILHRPVIFSLPVAASIEPANWCNLSCIHCPTGNGQIQKERNTLDLDDYKYFIGQIAPTLLHLNLFFQGEPMLNTAIDRMVAYATALGISTTISTNGHFMTQGLAIRLKEAGLGNLIVSLDGANPQSYVQYRQGGDFHKVINTIRTAVEAGLHVELQTLILSSTENDMKEIRRIARDLGVTKLTFKTAQLYNNELAPSDGRMSRYRHNTNGNLIRKKSIRNKCLRLWTTVVIDSHGNVLPCCFDKSSSHRFGNLHQNRFSDIWFSDQARDFRDRVLTDRQSIEICTNCTE